jgi:uncharacterized protein YcbK (DUF882 family)
MYIKYMTTTMIVCAVLTSASMLDAGRHCNRQVTPAYKRTLLQWQKAPDIEKPRFRQGYRDLALHSIYHGDTVRDFPFLPNGKLDPRVLFKYKRVFRDKKNGEMHSIHPRLIKLLYKLARTFRALQINVISGYRKGAEQDQEKNHAVGRAVDLIIPGVKIADVAVRARQLGHVGVGLYPNAGFVHLDVRDGPSYFWIDRSGPNKPSCHKPVLQEIIPFYDNRWNPRFDRPRRVLHYNGKPLGFLTPAEVKEILHRSEAAIQNKKKRGPTSTQ